MNADKREILERYGRLRQEMLTSYQGHPRMDELQLEMAKVLFDMDLNDLTKQDYADLKKEKYKSAQEKSRKEKSTSRNKTLNKGIVLTILGIALVLIGIGLSDFTSGSMIFYGLAFSGFALLILGAIEIYIYNKMK